MRRSPVTGKPATGKPAAAKLTAAKPATGKAAIPRLPGLLRDPLGHRTGCAQWNFLVRDPAGDHRAVVTDPAVVRM